MCMQNEAPSFLEDRKKEINALAYRVGFLVGRPDPPKHSELFFVCMVRLARSRGMQTPSGPCKKWCLGVKRMRYHVCRRRRQHRFLERLSGDAIPHCKVIRF